ncbi:MAG: phosphatase PAP2 family protein [Ruminococcus sp.]|nr:phosphatase PAP2 family protein [Ruminococcus sp.]
MINELDFKILDWIQQNCRNEVMDFIMPKVTFLGNLGLLWIVVSVIFLMIKKHRKCGITLSFGLVFSFLAVNVIMKNLIARSRPCWINDDIEMLIAIPRDYSFPSGHTLFGFLAAVIIISYDKRFGIPAFLIAFAIAFSRMYLYVHFPSDVLAGMILGIAIGIFSVLVMKKIMLRYEEKKLTSIAG